MNRKRINNSAIECPICLIPYDEPTTFACGHSCCMKEARQLSVCPLCGDCISQPERLVVNTDMRDMIAYLTSKRSAKIEKVNIPYDNPTTFPCGHSLNIEEAKLCTFCPLCGESIPEADKMVVNFAMRDLISMYNNNNNTEEDFESSSEEDIEISSTTSNIINSLSVSKNKKKKSKSKKKKNSNHSTESHVLERYSGLFLERMHVSDCLDSLKWFAMSGCQWAEAFYAICLYKHRQPESPNNEEVVLPKATKLLPFLIDNYISYQNNKYYLFLRGMIELMLKHREEAIHYLERSAQCDYDFAGLYLAEIYAFHEPKDKILELQWYKHAADKGLAMAQYFYAMHLDRRVVDTEYILKYLKLAASQGCSEAQYTLGHAEYFGFQSGLTANESYELRLKASKGNHLDATISCVVSNWSDSKLDKVNQLDSAAKKGNVLALIALGEMYSTGHWVTIDYGKSFGYYKKAADKKHVDSQFVVGHCYETGCPTSVNFQEAVRYYKLAADQGHVGAQLKLGNYYLNGGFETEINIASDKSKANNTLALQYSKLAADEGNAEAQFLVGQIYSSDNGGNDDAMSVNYYKMSAEQGYPFAHCALAVCYLHGMGVKINIKKAFFHCQIAANQENALALHNLGMFHIQGVGTPVNMQEGLKWLNAAAALGNPESINAVTYYEGLM